MYGKVLKHNFEIRAISILTISSSILTALVCFSPAEGNQLRKSRGVFAFVLKVMVSCIMDSFGA